MHIAQVPPPPQADGKNKSACCSAPKRVPPASTSTSLSPLIVSFTAPELTNRLAATTSIVTNSIIISVKTIADKIITVVFTSNSIF